MTANQDPESSAEPHPSNPLHSYGVIVPWGWDLGDYAALVATVTLTSMIWWLFSLGSHYFTDFNNLGAILPCGSLSTYTNDLGAVLPWWQLAY